MSSWWYRRVGVPAVALLAVAGGAVACGPGADEPPASGSGVTGSAVVDVGCPALPTGQDCPTRPLTARLDLHPVGSAGPSVSEVTGADGHFTIDLPPGTYELVATEPRGAPLPSAEPMTVTVLEGEYTEVTVTFDSGVR
jgi:hypothetical protein